MNDPSVAEDARRLVEPSFLLRGVYPNNEHVGRANVRHLGDIEPEWRIAAQILPQQIPVQGDGTVAKYTIELDRQASPAVRRFEGEHLPIPTDARIWIIAMEGLESPVR